MTLTRSDKVAPRLNSRKGKYTTFVSGTVKKSKKIPE